MSKLKEFGIVLADRVATFVGSWQFIIWQTVILLIWMTINVEQLVHFDPYPFILMNLLLSSQAAYATPMILMSSNRQSERDREQLQRDLDLDENTNQVIKEMSQALSKLDQDLQLDRQALKEHLGMRQELAELKQEFKKLNTQLKKK